jgi:hypothetical protein
LNQSHKTDVLLVLIDSEVIEGSAVPSGIALLHRLDKNNPIMKYTFNLLFILMALQGYSQEFHVTTDGDDGAAGTSSAPWGSIQHAMDNASPGSTVYIHSGNYNERVYLNVSGTEDNYITFKAFGNDEVILDGTGLSDYALVEIYDVHHIAIEGIKIGNNEQLDAVGILIEGACDHIRIEDCDIFNVNFSTNPNDPISDETNAQALIVYGDRADHAITDLEIIDNEIYDCRLGYSEALAVNGNVDGFLISENEVHDVTNIGIDIIGHEGTCDDPLLDQARNGVISDNETYNCLSPYATSAGIYVDGGKDLIIERNRVHHNQWGIEIGCENIGKSTSGIIIRNNFIYRNSTAGLHVGGYDYPSGSGKVEDCIVVNNSFFGNDTENDYTGELYLSYNEGLILRNNIFYADNENGAMMSDEELPAQSSGIEFVRNAWFHPAGDGNLEWAYNGSYYETLDAFQSGTGFSSASFFEDPQYASIGSEPDLHLTASTSVNFIDYGSLFLYYGELDIDGENRVAGASVDIGADEYESTVGLWPSHYQASFILFPNPTKEHIYLNMIDKGTPVSYEIMDAQGRVVRQGLFHELSKMVIPLKGLQNGVYVFRVQFQDGLSSTATFVKE